MHKYEYELRSVAKLSDVAAVERLLVRARAVEPRAFDKFEIGWAAEMVADAVSGRTDDYKFLFLEDPASAELAGYTCFGPIAKERPGRFDLYWIGVCPLHQKRGLGRMLLNKSADAAIGMGATNLYIETGSLNSSGNALYKSAGYKLMGAIEEFYADDNNKHVYGKRIA